MFHSIAHGYFLSSSSIIANKSFHSISQLNLRSVIERHVPADGVDPNRGGQLNLMVAELQPRIDLGGLLQRRSHQPHVAADPRHVSGDGVGTEERGGGGGGGAGSVGGGNNFQDGSLSGGTCRLDLGGVVCGHLDVDAGVLGGDERLEGAVVAGDGVELVRWHGCWSVVRQCIQQ